MANLTENITRSIEFADDIKDLIIQNKGVVPINTPVEDYREKLQAIIDAGGGEPPVVIGEFRIRYFYRDTVTGEEKIHTQWLERGENGVFPADVGNVQQTIDNPVLTFQGWNYTQSEMNNVQHDLDVGAIYVPTDDKTYLHVRINRAGLLTQTLYLAGEQYRTYGATVDWGDGTEPSYISGYTNLTFTHTYLQLGDYWITILFNGNGAMKNISIPDVIIGAFIGYSWNSGITGGGPGFSNCRSLTTITIPNSFSSFNAINNISLLSTTIKRIAFPSFITSITLTLSLSSVIEFISIPSTVLSMPGMGNSYFNESISLPDIAEITSNHFQNNYSLRSIRVPTTVTSIGQYAFDYCISLTTITIPEAVTRVNSRALGYCIRVKEFIFKRAIPPTIYSDTFQGINSTAKIFVPDESVEAYKTATNWVSVAVYIFPMSERKVN